MTSGTGTGFGFPEVGCYRISDFGFYKQKIVNKKSCSLYVQHLVVNYFSKETFLRILLKTVVAEEKMVARVFNTHVIYKKYEMEHGY